MAVELRAVSGYEALEQWAAARNHAGPDVLPPEMEALLRATELEHVDLLAFADGEPAGTAFVSADLASLATRTAFFEVKVVAARRGQGIGSAMLAAVFDEARRLGFHRLRCTVRADDARSFLERRGFELTRRMDQVSLELAEVGIPRGEAPAGVKVGWPDDQPDDLHGMFLVARETADRHAGRRAGFVRSELEWRTYELGSPLVRLDLTAVARVEDDVVGYSVVEDFPGHAVVFHRVAAVRREWEPHGVAEAMVRAQIAAAREDGVEAMVAVPPTQGLSSLFARLGYRPRKAWLEFEGPTT